MTEFDTPKQPSTPQQAHDIYTGLGELTALRGKNYGDTHLFGEVPVETPPEVATHFPKTENDSHDVQHTVDVTQKFDRESGEPRRSGVVGMVTFNQKEHRDQGLIYATHINYHVLADDGENYRLERHVTNTEHGPHRVAQHRQEMGRMATREGMVDKLAEMTALRDRVEATRGMEESLGLLTVSQPEAQQIIDVVTGLNAAS